MNAVAACLLFLLGLMSLWGAAQSREFHNRPFREEDMSLVKGTNILVAGILIWAAVLLITPTT